MNFDVGKFELGVTWMKRFRMIVLAAALSITGVFTARADLAPPVGVPTDDGMPAFALQWFLQLQAGKIDRAQYNAAYCAGITDDAVQAMSQQLNRYGASPLRAAVVRKSTVGSQTFYVMELLFPRGDAASLLFSFDTEGKIAGVAVDSMAGD
jgi:hypothetical protein